MHTSFAYYVNETLASMGFLFSLFKCSCHIICVNNADFDKIQYNTLSSNS